MFTIVQAEDGSRAGEGSEELSDDVEGKLPDLEFAQDDHGQRHRRVHVASWERGRGGE